MDSHYLFLIIAVVIIFILTLVAILRYPKLRFLVKIPFGFLLKGEGEAKLEQKPVSTPEGSAAVTVVKGDVNGSKIQTIAGSGKAETELGGGVKKSDIKTKAG